MHWPSRFFTQPYPAHTDSRIYLRTISVISAVVFFILYVIRPFDWAEVADKDLFITAVVSSVATFLGMTLFYLWRYLFPSFFAERNWTLGREILLIIYQFTVVAGAVWLVRVWCGQYWYIPQRSYLFTWWVVSSVGAIPYILATSLKVIYHIRRYLADAISLNSELSTQQATRRVRLLLPRDYGVLDDFLYAESIDNYVEICWQSGGGICRQQYRCTLLELEECNPSSLVFRCHRAYVVNLQKVLHVTGNAAGFQLLVHADLPTIPVSRSYVSAFKKQIALGRTQLA